MKNERQIIRELNSYLKTHHKSFLLVCLFVAIVDFSEVAKPYVLKMVMDDYMATAANDWFSVLWLSILYMAFSFASGVFSFLQVNRMNRIGQDIVCTLREKVFRTIHYLPLSYYSTHATGSLVTRATNDITEIGGWYTDILISLLEDLLLLSGILTAMFLLDPKLAATALIVVPVVYLIFFVLKRKIKKSFFSMKHYIGKINGFFSESIEGMKLTQVFGAKKERLRIFQKLNSQYYKSTEMQVELRSILRPASSLLQDLAISLLLWQGIESFSGHAVGIGVLYAMIAYTRRFFQPISDLAEMYDSIQSSLVSARRVFELTDRADEMEEPDEGLNQSIYGTIEFQDVWFAYNENEWVLRGISFKVEKGQKVALIGETGAGKTTIINLICGFYRPQKGRILIDGEDICNFSLGTLRRSTALVLQDVFLFSGDIRQNITLRDVIPEDRLLRAMAVSGIETLACTLPGREYAPVTERGKNFSAGQRQLLTLARAVAHDPSIYIFDEATANIDTHTEKLIQKAIGEVSKDRTSIVIAHRLSTIRNSDKIIVIADGTVLETGNEKQLFEADGYYKRMLQC